MLKRLIKSKIKNLELRISRISEKRYINFLRKNGIEIGDDIKFHGKLNTISIDITRPSLVTIGSNISFNGYFNLITHDWGTYVIRRKYNEFIPSSGRVTIGNNVVFGRNVTVLKGVKIGDNCIIGNGSIVTKDIPSNSVAVGSPAKVISDLEEYYIKRKEKCIEEAFDYARSIQTRFNRRPVIQDFWEEFGLFLNGEDICSELPIKFQMGPAYEDYKKQHKAIFNGFDDFLKQAGIE
ncbi:acyltransferase [Marinifilum sp. D737]|uniref:acyltransferase n=1 Tax=Marinifilum sp. D737 TaxID=2969628 RepID=UPI002DD41BB4|nr:acyltransferase [Marinifilum sp. D737]